MALIITKAGNILTVIEKQYSFRGTKTSYWYYDVALWLMSSRGTEGSVPDRPMTPADIEWVQTHYLPKAVEIPPSN